MRRFRILIVGLVLVFVVWPGVAFGGDAVGYQQDQAHAGMAAEALPLPLERRWAVDLPLPLASPQYSYPLIVGNRVFVTGWSRGPNVLDALDLATGRLLWGPKAIGARGHWSGLTFDSGRLFTVADGGEVTAVDPATGATIWSTTLSITSIDSDPVSDGSSLYVASLGGLWSIDEADGHVRCCGCSRTAASMQPQPCRTASST